MGDDQLAKLTVEMQHIRDKVDHIDSKLEAMSLGSRLAVLEDRQTMIFKLVYGVFAILSTALSAIAVWIITR